MRASMKSVTCAVLLGLFTVAHAQQSLGPGHALVLENLTLRDAEALFIQRNRELLAARRAAEGAEADVISAAARPNPTISITPAAVSPTAGVHGRIDRNANTIMSVSQLIERGGKRQLRTQAAEYNAAALRKEELDAARQQRAAVYAAYYDLVLAEERIRITESASDLFRRSVDAANKRFKAGDIAAVDVTRISVDAGRAENDARAARGERERAQLDLAYLIGVEREAARIRPAEGWPDLSVLPQVTVEALLETRPDVQAAQARLQAAEKSRELAQALRTRDVTLGVNYDRFGDFRNNTIGVSVGVPIFTSYYFQGEIRRAEVDHQAAQDQLERARAIAATEIGKALSDLASATERIKRLREEILINASRAVEGAEFAYSRGAIGVMDLLDARRQFYATRLDAAAAHAEYAKALAAWRAATAIGTPALP